MHWWMVWIIFITKPDFFYVLIIFKWYLFFYCQKILPRKNLKLVWMSNLSTVGQFRKQSLVGLQIQLEKNLCSYCRNAKEIVWTSTPNYGKKPSGLFKLPDFKQNVKYVTKHLAKSVSANTICQPFISSDHTIILIQDNVMRFRLLASCTSLIKQIGFHITSKRNSESFIVKRNYICFQKKIHSW